MKVEQLYTSCLAQGAYFIESNGEAAVIDPLREVDSYIRLAQQTGSRITYIFETHFHADFVSGHLELAEKTGATIVYGPEAVTGFQAHIGRDEEIFKLGALTITLLHTPGHTLESSCYLLQDHEGKPQALFTGDTLFIGDVGRPDLAQQAVPDLTQDKLAGMLYDSIRTKINPLPDEVIIYPAHGAGSACGKNISRETADSLGNQKRTNYALDPALSREKFIRELNSGLKPAPAYFPMNVKLNSQGYPNLANVIKNVQNLSPLKLKELSGVILLDTRDPDDFARGHVPQAINIGLNGSFAPWVGALLPHNQLMVIITAPHKVTETITRLSRIGYDNVVGYLDGGMAAWEAAGLPVETTSSITAQDFRELPNPITIDVRNEAEFEQGAVPGAWHLPLGDLDIHPDLAADQTYYVYCAGGYRSMIYISLMKARKNINMVNIEGGYTALKHDPPAL